LQRKYPVEAFNITPDAFYFPLVLEPKDEVIQDKNKKPWKPPSKELSYASSLRDFLYH
jgi:hypothetical protein